MSRLSLSSPVGDVKGVGEVRRKALARLGIETVEDLIRHYPRAYQNRGDTKTTREIAEALSGDRREGLFSTVLAVATEPVARLIKRGMNVLKFSAFDEYGKVEMTFFNQPYLKDTFRVGKEFRFWGKVEREGGRLKMTSPLYEAATYDLPALVPVYPLASGISQKFISGIIKAALDEVSESIGDVFSESFCRKWGIETLCDAIEKIHAPRSLDEIDVARRRLCFEEIFMTAAALASEKSRGTADHAPAFENTNVDRYVRSLPYELTEAQKRSLREITGDLEKDVPMRRILIGDVGSGKTAVAAGAAYAAVASGYQCAIMVPTDILANQHFEEFRKIFSPLGINVELLTGSMSAKEKHRVRAVIAGDVEDLTGGVDIIIGTHALITDDVEYEKLGLVITDEQHRFGVMQRAALAGKTNGVHILAMSATPIPRTLSLVYYGDLSLSRLDEMPPGRQRVDTYVVDDRYRDRINKFIRTHARAGNRTYIVCPMVEESEAKSARENERRAADDPEEMANVILTESPSYGDNVRSTVEFARECALRLPDLSVGMIHGKMKSAQKDAVMKDFCDGKIDVLVATTVIEVGVNVPEATLMIVENAERFGLSTLHQLRGRVGRSDRKSFCILVSNTESEKAKERLSVMKNTYDGFEIAEYDLKMRGAGDFFSPEGRIRQHGDASSMITDSDADRATTEAAVAAARETVSADPTFALPENRLIGERIAKLRGNIENTLN